MSFDTNYSSVYIREPFEIPTEKTRFSFKYKMMNKNLYTNYLNRDDLWYFRVATNFRSMSPTDLAHLHSENIKGLIKLQAIYRKTQNKKNYNQLNKKNYNQLAEFHNILQLSQNILIEKEAFIQSKVKEFKDTNFEYKIDEYLTNFRAKIQSEIDSIFYDKYLTKSKKSFFISNCNKRRLYEESIYNEVLKRLRKLKSEGVYMEVSPDNVELASDEPTSGNRDNVEPASGNRDNVEPDYGEHASDEPDYGEHASDEPDYGVSASGEHASGVPASGGNRCRSIRNRKHTKVTRRHKVTRTTRVIRKRKI
jgi:hypothetical protein